MQAKNLTDILARNEFRKEGDAHHVPAGVSCSVYLGLGDESLVIDRVTHIDVTGELATLVTLRRERYAVEVSENPRRPGHARSDRPRLPLAPASESERSTVTLGGRGHSVGPGSVFSAVLIADIHSGLFRARGGNIELAGLRTTVGPSSPSKALSLPWVTGRDGRVAGGGPTMRPDGSARAWGLSSMVASTSSTSTSWVGRRRGGGGGGDFLVGSAAKASSSASSSMVSRRAASVEAQLLAPGGGISGGGGAAAVAGGRISGEVAPVNVVGTGPSGRWASPARAWVVDGADGGIAIGPVVVGCISIGATAIEPLSDGVTTAIGPVTDGGCTDGIGSVMAWGVCISGVRSTISPSLAVAGARRPMVAMASGIGGGSGSGT